MIEGSFHATVQVPARAGGGQGSNPGGGAAGGGSPSVGVPGGGGGGLPILPFVGGFPIFVVLFVIGGAILRAPGRRRGGHHGTAADSGTPPPPPPPPARSAQLEVALAAIKARDPAFDEPGLLDEVAGIHGLVNRSWVQLDPDAGRSVLGEALFVERKQALVAKATRGEQPHADDLHIGRSDLIGASIDREAHSQSVVVRIHAYSRSFDLDATGELLSGDRTLRLWTEDWQLTRPDSEVTRRAAGTSQTCPRCGAPLSLRDDGTCGFCQAQVAAGASGWRVTMIEPVL